MLEGKAEVIDTNIESPWVGGDPNKQIEAFFAYTNPNFLITEPRPANGYNGEDGWGLIIAGSTDDSQYSNVMQISMYQSAGWESYVFSNLKMKIALDNAYDTVESPIAMLIISEEGKEALKNDKLLKRGGGFVDKDPILTSVFGDPEEFLGNEVLMNSYENTWWQYADGVVGLIETPNGDRIVFTTMPKSVIVSAKNEPVPEGYVLRALENNIPKMTPF